MRTFDGPSYKKGYSPSWKSVSSFSSSETSNTDFCNWDLHASYQKMFGCRVSFSYIGRILVLRSADGQLFSLEDVSTEEINNLTAESISVGKNMLLQTCSSTPFCLDVQAGCDY